MSHVRNLESYLSTLLPSFERNRISNALEDAGKELTETVIPVYRSVEEAFQKQKFHSKFAVHMDRIAKKELRGYKDSIQTTLLKKLMALPATIELSKELSNEYFNTTVTLEQLTYAKYNVLRITEMLQFVNLYSRRLLLVLCTLADAEEAAAKLREKAFAKELHWLEKGISGYIEIVNILTIKPNELRTMIKAIPDLRIESGKVDETLGVVGAAKVDPLKIGIIPYKWNPIYMARKLYASIRHSAWERANEEKLSTELRIQQLKEIASEEGRSPKIDKLISNHEAELSKINKRIAEYEEDSQ